MLLSVSAYTASSAPRADGHRRRRSISLPHANDRCHGRPAPWLDFLDRINQAGSAIAGCAPDAITVLDRALSSPAASAQYGKKRAFPNFS